MRNTFEEQPVFFRKSCKRYNVPRQSHFLTFSCLQRRPFLSRDRSRNWFVDAVNIARERHAFDLWAYVIMPEHAHLVIFPRREQYSISNVLTTVKQWVTRRALAFVKQEAPGFLAQMADRQPSGRISHRFWQRGGGYDRNLRDTDEIWEKINYSHNNPVERGLCATPKDWPWSSAGDYLGIRKGPLELNLDSLPR